MRSTTRVLGGGVPSLGNLRQQACRALQGTNATDTPRLDADLLLGHVIGFSRAQLIAHEQALLDAERTAQFEDLVRRRLAGEPVAYLIGRQEFYELPFTVTPDVLVPRPETETLVETVFELCADPPPDKILDLGTGSGCIAIVLAHAYLGALIWATDPSPGARRVAAANAETLGCAHRVTVVEHAFGAPLPAAVETPVDLVVSNPPYLSTAEWEAAGPAVRAEPRGALDAGETGLEAYPALIGTAEAALRPGGRLILEIGATQARDVSALLAPRRWTPAEVRRDLAGHDRVVAARRRA